MKTCTSCGVELENNMNYCPLCGEPVMPDQNDNRHPAGLRKHKQEGKPLTDFQKLNAVQKRKIFWEISGIILLSGILIPMIIDLIISANLTWSKFSVSACAALLINITLICLWPKNGVLLLLGSFLSLAMLLILLDAYTGSYGWGLQLGLPLLLAFYFILFILIYIIRKARLKQLNLISYSLIACGLFCIVSELFISLYLGNNVVLRWSLLVMASVLPVAGILFYIHSRLKKGTDLRRFFHI
ncbi:MAG: zinc-ribbon domain-containing protein [Bacteroidetes bacterium]|nr:zinc-ribbon domain-containing protein [Bacteroidota bacterium]